ncbi:MAG: metallophosphoesterase [Cyanobacteria bacterium]|nr:metallophosphoesterase [Cyanobacteriota bacterium]
MRTLVHLSDLHFGRIDRALVEPLRRAVSDLQPDLVAISGDFTQRARRSQFADARAFIDSLKAKTLVVPGNHDIPLYDFVERLAAPLARYRKYISADLEPEYQDEEMIVLGVNTARSMVFPFGEGRFSMQQVDRILERLKNIPKSLLRVIVTHHPFDLPPGVHERRLVGRYAMAMERLAAASADLFLSGHLHISHVSHVADRYKAGGHAGLIVQAGTVSTRGRGGQAPSFNVLRLHRPGIELERYSWDDSAAGFTSLPVGRYRHSDSGWTLDKK